MVFTPTTLFKNIPCPEGEACVLTNCIYAHDTKPEEKATVTQAISTGTAKSRQSTDEAGEPASKRRKVTYGSLADKPPSRADLIRNQLAETRAKPDNANSGAKTPSSLVKPVSPPPTTTGKATSPPGPNPETAATGTNANAKKSTEPEKAESLNPRLVSNDPAGHQKRSLYLKHLHAEMVRLNRLVKEQDGLESKHLLFLSEQKLIKLALDEEEKLAREQKTMYANVVKQRIASLRKMKIDDWIKHVQSSLSPNEPKQPSKGKRIDTDLPPEQEHLILPQLVADQKPLAAFGYVPVPPTLEEAAEAAAAVEASQNYEICDRCSGRFQVFPERNEEGLLAGGPCVHHPNRKVYPPRAKTDRETGEKQPYYPCCNEVVGMVGCTRNNEHVFKTSSPARLAATLPFINTPENPSPAKDRRGKEVRAVTFDCEMGYTAKGLELIRLTAVTWPAGEELLDILVRPVGAIIDLNSRFSGVFHEHYKKAIPYDEWKASPPRPSPEDADSKQLPIVESPARARELLCTFITPKTPLIGHAIDNDLNTVRLCHPTIVDTVVLFPHPRGLPMRFGLRMLAQRHLDRAIQTGGDRGHDSKEDAVATGDLVRVKVAEKWKRLRASGWQIIDNQLIPPPPLQQSTIDAQTAIEEQSAKAMVEKAVFGFGKKRKSRASTDGADDGGDSDEGDRSNVDLLKAAFT
ncbi:RNA exonuclease 3 [Lecanosticta acicola]|uniref:RNA exonuclease 3 n=1 Tax=Lecanosticta acicola TaxID=111012 RepID=A0AAI8Z6X5_9PEZI|nr:RNA exonuclease 3 [Lecanosticta acicola]